MFWYLLNNLIMKLSIAAILSVGYCLVTVPIRVSPLLPGLIRYTPQDSAGGAYIRLISRGKEVAIEAGKEIELLGISDFKKTIAASSNDEFNRV